MSNSSGEYEDHVARQNTAYLIAFEEFEAGLSVEERALLRGTATPDIEDHQADSSKRLVFGIDRDVADSSKASYVPDLASEIDSVADEVQEKWGVSRKAAVEIAAWVDSRIAAEAESRKAAVIVKISGVFLHCANVRLLAAGLAYAADLALTYGMGTMEAWASKHGLSRAAVSKNARFWKRELGLPGGSHMRKEEICASYSEAQKTKHWRHKKYGNKTD
jgi:hypothetical protein